MRLSIAISVASLFLLLGAAASAQIAISAVDGSVRVDPVTSMVIESNWIPPELGPGHDYLLLNPVFDRRRGSILLQGSKNETVAFQVIVEALDPSVEELTIELRSLTGPSELEQGPHIRLYWQWYTHLRLSSQHARSGQVSSRLETWFPIGSHSQRLVNSFGPGWYPDALIPLQGPLAARLPRSPLSIPNDTNQVPGQRIQGFWIDIWIPPQSPPGLYRGEVVVGSADGDQRLPVELTVLPVTLPDTFHAGIGSVSYDFFGVHLARLGPGPLQEAFRLCHEHRLTIDALYFHPEWQNGHIDWTRYDELVGPVLDGSAFQPEQGYHGPGRGQPVKRFVTPLDWNWPLNQEPSSSDADGGARQPTKVEEEAFVEALVAVESHILEKGWTETEWNLFINTTDEPRTVEAFVEIERYGTLLQKAPLERPELIQYRIDAGPFKSIGREIPNWDVNRIFEEVGEVVDIWNCCGGVPFVPIEELRQRRSHHPEEQSWFYFSNAAGEPAVGSLLIDAEALGPRTWGWILWRYGFDAGVSWEIGWPDAGCLSSPDCSGYGLNGDASLLYLADSFGVEGAVLPSIRLKGLRRGAEDYEYLWLLEQRGLGDLADAYARRLVPRALSDGLVPGMNGAWVHDPSVFDAVRREMGLVLAGEMNPPDPAIVQAAAPEVRVPSPLLSRRAAALGGVLLIIILLCAVLFTLPKSFIRRS